MSGKNKIIRRIVACLMVCALVLSEQAGFMQTQDGIKGKTGESLLSSKTALLSKKAEAEEYTATVYDAQQSGDELQEAGEKEEQTQSVGIASKINSKSRPVFSWKPVKGAESYSVLKKKEGSFIRVASLSAITAEKKGYTYTGKKLARGCSATFRLMVSLDNGETLYSDNIFLARSIKKVKKVSLSRYSTHAIKVSWKPVKKAKEYKVFYAVKKKKGKKTVYKAAGNTTNTSLVVKGLKNRTKYIFYVRACKSMQEPEFDSAPSKKVCMTTRKFSRTTVFAGDSITAGLASYHMVEQIKIGGNKKLVAAIGLNTMTYRSRRVFGGKTGLQKVISYKPYRVYLLLGINEIHYRKYGEVIADYGYLVDSIKKSSPGTEIVILPLAPVSKAEQAKRTGFKQISTYNNRLKKLAGKKNCRYFDYTDFLKNQEGFLKEEYSASDGVHWNASGYKIFAGLLEDYDRSLDK